MMPSETSMHSQTECPMNKQYIVRLSDDERRHLTELTRQGKAAAYTIRHAQILLKAERRWAGLDGCQDCRALLRQGQYRAGRPTTLCQTGA